MRPTGAPGGERLLRWLTVKHGDLAKGFSGVRGVIGVTQPSNLAPGVFGMFGVIGVESPRSKLGLMAKDNKACLAKGFAWRKQSKNIAAPQRGRCEVASQVKWLA
mmetsp:Transcript_61068/g.176947  ORF Transcript_61068/g.176947 Transcript_61068/m.176947 type:complete len:105 (+) Transcript_61068:1367-1681(+)